MVMVETLTVYDTNISASSGIVHNPDHLLKIID